MNGTIADTAKVELLTNQLAVGPINGMSMGLSTTNITPTHATVLADLTPGELTVAGYARQAVSGWSFPTLQPDFSAAASAGTVTFTNSGGSASPTVYTWFFVDATGTYLIAAGQFSSPFAIQAGGEFSCNPSWDWQGNP
jgi:hypothetical protein